MSIKGNTVGTPMPRTDWNQKDPKKADYLKGRDDLEKAIGDAKKVADNALPKAGGAMTGNVSMGNHKVTDLSAPENDGDASNKKYVDDSVGNALPKSGGEMTGDVAMGGNKVTGLADPTDDGDAVSKKYVEDYVKDQASSKTFTVALTLNDWVGSEAPYTQTIGLEGILATDCPHYGVVYSKDQATRLAEKEAFSFVDDLTTDDGSVVFTCFEEKPGVVLNIQMEVNR